MSVIFWIDGSSPDDEESFMSLNNGNAAALVEWLGLNAREHAVRPDELTARCRLRLAQPGDSAVSMVVLAGCIVVAGRPFAYLRDRTEDMLRLSARAGERLIRWA